MDAESSRAWTQPHTQVPEEEARLQRQAYLAEISEVGEIGGPKSRADRRIA